MQKNTNLHWKIQIKCSKKFAKESLKSRISGPFKKKPLKNVVCSPLDLVPKAVNSKFRLIHDLSYPKGNYVNSLIPPKAVNSKFRLIHDLSYPKGNSVNSLIPPRGVAAHTLSRHGVHIVRS